MLLLLFFGGALAPPTSKKNTAGLQDIQLARETSSHGSVSSPICMKSCPHAPPSIVQLLSLKRFGTCRFILTVFWAWNQCIGTAVTHDNMQVTIIILCMVQKGWSYWWQGIVLFHDKSNLPLHFTIVYPVTLLILQSLPFFGRFFVIPLLCQLQWIMVTKWQPCSQASLIF